MERWQKTEGCGREVAAESYGRYTGQRDKRPEILSESQDRQRQRARKKDALAKKYMEETRLAKMLGLSQQGAWTRWENYVRRRITWWDLWRSDFGHLRFQIKEVYDGLPSPSDHHTWGKSNTPACQLCGGKGSLQNLLSGCARSLSEGRRALSLATRSSPQCYCWRGFRGNKIELIQTRKTRD